MGMSLDTYLGLTPYQFGLCWQKHQEQKQQERQAAELVQWQVARWQVWRSLCPPQKKKISQFDLITLPGDDQVKEQTTTAKKTAPRDEHRFRTLADKWK